MEISSAEFTMPIFSGKELTGDSLVEIFHGFRKFLAGSVPNCLKKCSFQLFHLFYCHFSDRLQPRKKAGRKMEVAEKMNVERLLGLQRSFNVLSVP